MKNSESLVRKDPSSDWFKHNFLAMLVHGCPLRHIFCDYCTYSTLISFDQLHNCSTMILTLFETFLFGRSYCSMGSAWYVYCICTATGNNSQHLFVPRARRYSDRPRLSPPRSPHSMSACWLCHLAVTTNSNGDHACIVVERNQLSLLLNTHMH